MRLPCLACCHSHCHMCSYAVYASGRRGSVATQAGIPAGRVSCWVPIASGACGGRPLFLFLCLKRLLKLKPISLPILTTVEQLRCSNVLLPLSLVSLMVFLLSPGCNCFSSGQCDLEIWRASAGIRTPPNALACCVSQPMAA